MLIDYHLGQTGVVLRVKIRNSSVATGAGLTGLTNASAGLIISTIADNEATATAYTAGGSTIDSITTLGTFAAPTAGHCRFKEVDSTNHKGVYEIQVADARFAVSNAKSLLISISGATNAAECDVCIPLRTVDPYSAAFGLSLAKGTNLTGLNDIAATAIVSGGAITTSSGAVSTVTTVTNQLTAAAIATAIWQDTTAGDFATASSPGKILVTQLGGAFTTTSSSVYSTASLANAPTGGSAPTAATIAAAVWDLATSGHTTALTFGAAMNAAGSAGDPWATALPGAYGAGTAGNIVGTNLNATVSSRMATFALPANFAALGLTPGGKVSGVVLVDTLTTYTGNTPQTGDSFTRIGAAGAGLTALGDTRIAHLDADISTRSAYAGADTSGTTTLLTRLSSTRSGYLDNLSAGAVALASQIPANFTTATFASAGVFSVGALANAPTGGSAPTAAAIRQEIDTNSTQLAGIKAKTDNLPASPAAVGSAMILSSAGLDGITIESGVNARQSLSLIAAACAGVISGAGSGTVTIKGGNVATTRIVATTDGSGNRTALTLTPPA